MLHGDISLSDNSKIRVKIKFMYVCIPSDGIEYRRKIVMFGHFGSFLEHLKRIVRERI